MVQHKFKRVFVTITILVALITSLPALAERRSASLGCLYPFSIDIKKWANELKKADKNSIHLKAINTYEKLLKRNESLSSLLRPSAVHPVLMDEDQPLLVERLFFLLQKLERTPPFEYESALKKNLNHLLRSTSIEKALVPIDSIADRVKHLFASDPESLRYALGALTVEDNYELLVGKDFRSPSSTSVIGRIISETGAAYGVQTFSRANDFNSTNRGPERLIVQVSETSWPVVERLLFNQANGGFPLHHTGHAHSPGQGTLLVHFRGKVFSYSREDSSVRLPSSNAVWSLIILSTSEAERMNQYYRLGKTHSMYTRHPWSLSAKEGCQFPLYCAKGGYTSCTHWWGDLPIGDKKVKRYLFPGNVDQHAGNALSSDPQSQVLMPIKKNITGNSATDRLIHQVWKSPEGNAQLWEVLGLCDQQTGGELANPGYTLLSHLGYTKSERIPVVLYFVPDHKAPLINPINPQVNAY